MTFIKGRQIMGAALIANECVDTRLRGEVPGIMCKLDIEKAYDHVNWDFLLNILRQMGFGESVNWRKSNLFPIKEVVQMEELAGIFGCKVMSLFPIPISVVKKLDRLRRNFLWFGNKKGKGYHLVEWKTAQLHKEAGGLGVRNLKLPNDCLLMKWLWRLNGNDHALWKEVILNKYGQTEQWCTNAESTTYETSVWRSIRNLWPRLVKNSCYEVGAGNKILFWKDLWIGQEVLMQVFPDLASICTNLEVTVADSWSPQGWNFFFRRHLNDREVGRFVELLQMIDGFEGTTVEDDTFRWKHDKDGKFSVGRIYRKEVSWMPENKIGPWKHVWKSMAPTKVKCFAWLVIRKACLTHEILQ
ncbi:hypothetical protein MTR67_027244 [Solanum verrucosum]|uniref:Reverse transcriptase zinc-binding domain-containing protein n=1 Tax=Solanum verrucosum TaxID=315347 RepID=A0AAF0R989_SOLVR|nr:hypothetical protein MTR67_027244 [Solanum verrucosum]